MALPSSAEIADPGLRMASSSKKDPSRFERGEISGLQTLARQFSHDGLAVCQAFVGNFSKSFRKREEFLIWMW
jgi:hypothetical protein